MSREKPLTPEEFRRRWRSDDWSGLGQGQPYEPQQPRLEYTVPGQPVPKGRPRFYGGRAVTPKRTREFEARVREWFAASFPRHRPWTGDVALGVTAYGAHHAADADNILKAVSDALNGVAYRDDVQVRRTLAEKLPADEKGPRTVIVVMRLDGESGDPAGGLREQRGESS